MSVLSRLVAPLSEEEFLRDKWGKSFFYNPRVGATLPPTLTWSDLNRALEQHRFESPRLRLELNRRRINPEDYTILRPTRRGVPLPRLNVTKVQEFIRNGATLVLDSIDEVIPSIGILSEQLTGIFCTHLQVNAYAGTGHDPGFGLHWDDHDVFILQMSGRKRWKVYAPTRPWPLYRDIEENAAPTDAPVWDHIIEPGDFLYLPRGQWHDVVGIDEPTLHITIGINNPTGISLFNWLIDKLREFPEVRQDLPILLDTRQQEIHLHRLIETLKSQLTNSLLADFVASQRANLTSRPHFSFPFSAVVKGLPDDDGLVLRFSGCTATVTEEENSNEVTVHTLGAEWRFKKSMKALLLRFISGEPVSFADSLRMTSGTISRDKMLAFLSHLVTKGFLHVERLPESR